MCYTCGAGLCISTFLRPSPEDEGRWVPKITPSSCGQREKSVANGGVFRHYPHGLDLLCEEIALTINELESFC